MDDDLSMDSFVDIVANTVGMVIILTMLTIARVDERGMKLNVELKNQMDKLATQENNLSDIAVKIMGKSRGLVASGSDLGIKAVDVENLAGKTELEKAMSLLKRMNEIQKRSEELKSELELATRRHRDVKTRHLKIKQDLASLRARKRTLTTAMKVRKKVEAQLVTDLPGLNMGEFERTPLTSMKQEVKKLESDIAKMEDEANIGCEEYNGLMKDVEEFKKQEASLKDELAKLQEVADLDIEIARPPSLGEQMKLPVFFECFAKAPAEGGQVELRVRFVGEGASPEGEHYRNIADPASEFSKFLTGQTDEFKASRRLHFIVRPDAGAAFRKARKAARKEGWTVGWNPIGKDVPLDLVPSSSENTTASAPTPAFVAPR